LNAANANKNAASSSSDATLNSEEKADATLNSDEEDAEAVNTHTYPTGSVVAQVNMS
jgi:hypothetical protein